MACQPPASWAGRCSGCSSCLFIIAPSACFLVLARLTRLFSQGPQWFTLTYLRADVHRVDRGRGRQLAVGQRPPPPCWAGIGFPIAWLAHAPTCPAGGWWRRRHVASAAAAVVAPGPRLGAAGPAGRGDVPGRARPALGHPRHHGARSGWCCCSGCAACRLSPSWPSPPPGRGSARSSRTPPGSTAPAGRPALRLILRSSPRPSGRRSRSASRIGRDFGVAATLAYNSNFSLATYQVYRTSATSRPTSPGAAAIGWLLVAAVALPLCAAGPGAARAVVRGAVRADPAGSPAPASRAGAVAAVAGAGLFYVVALGPGFGAVSASLLGDTAGRTTSRWSTIRACSTTPG